MSDNKSAAPQAAPMPDVLGAFEAWLRRVCFQPPTPEAYDLAKCAWIDALSAAPVSEHPQEASTAQPDSELDGDYKSWITDHTINFIAWRYCHCDGPDNYDLTRFDCIEDVHGFARDVEDCIRARAKRAYATAQPADKPEGKAEQQAEPVAHFSIALGKHRLTWLVKPPTECDLYAHPPAQPQQLSDEQIFKAAERTLSIVFDEEEIVAFARALLAAQGGGK
jgi:hypothetical protein